MIEIELLTKRRRQLRYRANHRGIKEMDIILGGYADKFIEQLDSEQLDIFEKLMDQNDRDLLQWFTGELSTPDEFDTDMFVSILTHAKTGINFSRSGN